MKFDHLIEETLELYRLEEGFEQKIPHLVKLVKDDNNLFNKEDYVKWVAEEFDPTPNKEYITWILRMLAKGNIRGKEDAQKVKERLAQFHVLKRNPNFPKENRDINSFRLYGDLAFMVDDFKDVKTKGETNRQQQQEGKQLLADIPPYKIFLITTPEAAAKTFRNTDWCVKDPTYFKTYNPKEFYFISKDEKPYGLLHTQSEQFMDVYDRGFSGEKAIKEFIGLLEEIKDEKLENALSIGITMTIENTNKKSISMEVALYVFNILYKNKNRYSLIVLLEKMIEIADDEPEYIRIVVDCLRKVIVKLVIGGERYYKKQNMIINFMKLMVGTDIQIPKDLIDNIFSNDMENITDSAMIEITELYYKKILNLPQITIEMLPKQLQEMLKYDNKKIYDIIQNSRINGKTDKSSKEYNNLVDYMKKVYGSESTNNMLDKIRSLALLTLPRRYNN